MFSMVFNELPYSVVPAVQSLSGGHTLTSPIIILRFRLRQDTTSLL